MQFIYDLGIHLFTKGVQLASMFQPKAKAAIAGRKSWEANLKQNIHPGDQWIWMHCSSLGEFEQGRPIFDRLKEVFPHHKLALSFFSPSGYEIRKNYAKADLVFYHPFDTKNNAQKLAKLLQPTYLILVKYDYWFNHLQVQKSIGTQIIVISAIFRSNQVYFKSMGKWMAQQLKQNISHFFVQDAESQELLQSIGIDQVTVSGDTRFDRVKTIAKQTQELDWVREFKNDNDLAVIGSSWPKDEELWTTYFRNNPESHWKYIIVPHEIGAKHIQELQDKISLNSIKYSELQEGQNLRAVDVIIVDTIGLLSQIYASADLAYVGGGFKSSGVHNTLEPAIFGVPVIIGPNYSKFNEVKLLKEENVVHPIDTYEAFEEKLNHLMQDNTLRDTIYQRAKIVFDSQLPSTEIILSYFKANA